MLLPHVLGEPVCAGVAFPVTFGTSGDLTEVKDLIDPVNGSFVAGAIFIALEGRGAGELSAQYSALSLLSWGCSSLHRLALMGNR